MWRDLGGRPLDAPFCIDVTLPRFPTPTKDRVAIKDIADTSCPEKAVRRAFESDERKGGFILSDPSRFLSWETGIFQLSPATFVSAFTRLEVTAIGYNSELCPHPVGSARSAAFYYLYK